MRLPMCVTLAVLAGCAATPKNSYYTLSAAVPSGMVPPAAPGRAGVTLRSLHLPQVLDRTQLVERIGPNSVSISEFQRWAEPLDQMASRVLRDDLSLRSASGASREVSITVDEFMVAADGGALLSGQWHDAAASGDPGIGGAFRFSLATRARSLEGADVAAALSELLGELSDRITGVLQRV